MASRRNLNFIFIEMRYTRSFFFLFTFFLLSCGTSETVTDPDTGRPVFDMDEEIAEESLSEADMDEFERLLYDNRSRFSDQFAAVEQEIPEGFLKEAAHEQQGYDEYAGFRVQILSTRDVALADSTRDEFMAWANERIDGYQPEAYVYFRQPYYRVRTGDFRNRQHAIEFSRLLKNKYPGAWIVHDRIEPEHLPSQATEFRLLPPDNNR